MASSVDIFTLLLKTVLFLTQTASETPLPRNRFGRRGSTFSSVRLSQRVPSNPIRRNTTRARGRSYKKDKASSFKYIFIYFLNLNVAFLEPRHGYRDQQ